MEQKQQHEKQSYYMSKKFLPILYDNLLYKMGEDLLDRQYLTQ